MNAIRITAAAFVLILNLSGVVFSADYGKVGSATIDEKYVKLWEPYYKLVTSAGKFKDTRYFGVAQEIKYLLNLAIMDKYGAKSNNDALAQFATSGEHEKAESVAFYKELRSLLSTDEPSFVRTFFGNGYTEQILKMDVFRNNSLDINIKLKKQVDALAKSLNAKPASFKEIAKSRKYNMKTVTASVDNGIRVVDEKKSVVSISMSIPSKEAYDAAAAVKVGTVSTAVVNARDFFLIIKSKGKQGEEYLMDAIFIPKLSYDEWFELEAGKIPIKISDPKVRKEVKERATWAKNLKIN